MSSGVHLEILFGGEGFGTYGAGMFLVIVTKKMFLKLLLRVEDSGAS